MGLKALIVVFVSWAFTFLVWSNLPDTITLDTELYQLSFIVYNVFYAIAFVKFGLMK